MIVFFADVLTVGPGPPGCRQTTTMAEEIVFCCTNIRSLSTGLRHPRFPDRTRRVPAAWGPRLDSVTPMTALSSKRSSSSSNRRICVRAQAPRTSWARSVINRISRHKATSMLGPEWSTGTRNPRRSPRSTSPNAERIIRQVANVLDIIRPKAATSMWGAEWWMSGTRRSWTSLVSITRSVERVVNRVASVSDITRLKMAIRPMSVLEWPSGTRSHPRRPRLTSPSAALTVDSRVANVSDIIRLRRSVSPLCRDTTAAVCTPVPIVSRDSTTSAFCTASNGLRTIVTRSATRSYASTRRVQADPASMRTRTRSRALSPRRRSRRHRRRHRRTTASSRHRHYRPVQARSMPRARAWLIILLLIVFCPPILRGPSIVPTAPLHHRRCPQRSASPPPNGCWPVNNQPQLMPRINNDTLDRTVCFPVPHQSWDSFKRDFKRDSKVPGSTLRILATLPFPRTGYYLPHRYMLRCQRDSPASRKGIWANHPYTIGIPDKIHLRQHIMSGIQRWRRLPRGEFKSNLKSITFE